MLTLVFAIAALVMLGLSIFLIQRTSAYSRAGGDVYVKRQKLKIVGITLLFSAALLAVMAVGVHEAVTPDSLPPPEAIATEPYVPPVLSKPVNDPLANREPPMDFAAAGGTARKRTSDDIASLIAHPPITPTPAPELPLPSPPTSGATAAPDLPLSTPTTEAAASTPDLPPVPAESNLTPDEKFNEAYSKLSAMLKTNPNDAKAYGELGNLYAARQSWSEAQTNYEKSLSLDGTNSSVKYNLAQMQFVQRKYDAARSGFAAMEKDSELGDLATYKTFLCDLYGGHAEVAGKELDAFNQAGENASYYFANVANSLYQKKLDDAQDWLTSATHIYAQAKINLYTADLVELGYLPIAP